MRGSRDGFNTQVGDPSSIPDTHMSTRQDSFPAISYSSSRDPVSSSNLHTRSTRHLNPCEHKHTHRGKQCKEWELWGNVGQTPVIWVLEAWGVRGQLETTLSYVGKPCFKKQANKKNENCASLYSRDRTVGPRASCLENTLRSIAVEGHCVEVSSAFSLIGTTGRWRAQECQVFILQLFFSLGRLAAAMFLLNSQVLPQLLSFNTCFFPLSLPRNCEFPTVLLLLALACAAVLCESPPHPWPYTDLVTNSPRDTFPRPSTGTYHLLSLRCSLTMHTLSC